VGRHVKPASGRLRLTRGSALAVVWLAGLAAGFFAILAVAARYSCSASNHALACGSSGTALGAVIAVAVVAVVTTVTVVTYDRSPKRVLSCAALGLLLLAGCFLGAQGLLAST
jgi:hypothetical protein